MDGFDPEVGVGIVTGYRAFELSAILHNWQHGSAQPTDVARHAPLVMTLTTSTTMPTDPPITTSAP